MTRPSFFKLFSEGYYHSVLPSNSTLLPNDGENKNSRAWNNLFSRLATVFTSKHRKPWLKYLIRALAPAFLVYFVFWPLLVGQWTGPRHIIDKKPPLYKSYRLAEKKLSQHNLYVNSANNVSQTKYLFIANHVQWVGWGNAMQELILNAHLAYSAGRAFVWDEYTWNPDPNSHFTDFNGKLIPSRVPLSALISGPIIGGSFSQSQLSPPSISKKSFHHICPEPHIIDGQFVADQLRREGKEPRTGAIYERWVRILRDSKERCIEIKKESFQIFNFFQFGNPEILEIWPSLQNSPILSEFGWSPLINDAFLKNRFFFNGQALPTKSFSFSDMFSRLWNWSGSDNDALEVANTSTPIPGLLALHIRRGDFAEHCSGLFDWSSTWNGFNHFPGLPDRFDMPEDSEKRREEYRRRCYPNVTEIVTKVREIAMEREQLGGSLACSRFNNKKLKRIYVMTNGHESWVQELKEALNADLPDYWDAIYSSRDLTLSWEQKFVAQALDMLVAERSDVFVGNGWSSLTSNVVMLRMNKERDLNSTRFW